MTFRELAFGVGSGNKGNIPEQDILRSFGRRERSLNGEISYYRNTLDGTHVGEQSLSSGDGSVAVGAYSFAKEDGCTAVGVYSRAERDGATVVGRLSRAAGANSTHVGEGGTTSGINATSVGQAVITTGNESVQVGQGGAVTGARSTGVGQGIRITHNDVTIVGKGGTSAANGEVIIGTTGSTISQVWLGRGRTHTGAAQTTAIHASDGSGANVAGDNMYLYAGLGTGSATGGEIRFYTSAAGGAGSSLNPESLRVRITSTVVAVTGEITADSATITSATITAGTITGATIRTASSGARIELDSTNGLRAFDGSSNVISQITVGGSFTGKIKTTHVLAANADDAITVSSNNSNQAMFVSEGTAVLGNTIQFQVSSSVRLILSSTAITASGSAVFTGDGSGLTTLNATNISSGTINTARLPTDVAKYGGSAINGNIAFNSGYGIAQGGVSVALSTNGELYHASTLQAQWDSSSSATATALLLRGDGSVRRVSIDNSDLGSGAKRYLYLA